MKRTIIESPYAGDVLGNLAYVRACMADCLRRGEAPYASHALYTQAGVLDDNVPAERTLGIEAGFAWGDVADIVAFYIDRGWSSGMRLGLDRAMNRASIRFGCSIRTRTLGAPWSDLAASDAEMCRAGLPDPRVSR